MSKRLNVQHSVLYEFLISENCLSKKTIIDRNLVQKLLDYLDAHFDIVIARSESCVVALKCQVNKLLRKHFSKKGSKCRKNIIKNSSTKIWKWTLNFSRKCDTHTMYRSENIVYKKENAHLREQLGIRKKTLQSVNLQNSILRSENQNYEEEIKKTMYTKTIEPVRGGTSARNLRRIKNNQKEAFELKLAEVLPSSSKLHEVKIVNEKGEVSTYKYYAPGTLETTAENPQMRNIDYAIKIMDLKGVSQSAYHEFSMIDLDLPRSYQVKERIQEINKIFTHEIKDIIVGEEKVGIEVSLQTALTRSIAAAVEQKEKFVSESTTLRVKISGDGTNVGKHKKLIAITFTLVDSSTSAGFRGNELLALIYGSEEYNLLKSTLRNVIRDQKSITTVDVNGISYTIDWYLGGDYKWILMVCGLKGASSSYACVYCVVRSEDRGDFSKSWSMTDIDKGARTIAEMKRCVQTKKMACIHEPLFDIPITKIVIDNLHLFLRLCDRLLNWVIRKILLKDNVSVKNFSSREKPTMESFEKFLRGHGIHFNFYTTRDGKEIEYTDLQGPSYVKLTQVKFSVFFTWIDTAKALKLDEMWQMVGKLYVLLKIPQDKVEITDVNEIKTLARKWSDTYCELFQAKDVTPYVHVLRYHLSEMISIHGTISGYTQQGLENLNHQLTKSYFRGSNFHENAFVQVFERHYRIQYLHTHERKLAKVHHCSVCGSCEHRKPQCDKS